MKSAWFRRANRPRNHGLLRDHGPVIIGARIFDARIFDARIFDARIFDARIFDARPAPDARTLLHVLTQRLCGMLGRLDEA
jgi:hypothetical protein